jgi:hypothetical protein
LLLFPPEEVWRGGVEEGGGKREAGERVVKKGEVLKVKCFRIHYKYCVQYLVYFSPASEMLRVKMFTVQYLVYFSPASEMLGVKIKKKNQYLQSCLTHTVQYIQLYVLTNKYTQLYCNSLPKIKFSVILKITTLDLVFMVTEIFSVFVPCIYEYVTA